MHLNLDEEWTTVGKGSIGFIGFQSDNVQLPDLKTYKIWLTLHANTQDLEGRKAVISKLFRQISWEGYNADITVRLASPLKAPQKLLRSYADQIASSIWRWELEQVPDECTVDEDLFNDEDPA